MTKRLRKVYRERNEGGKSDQRLRKLGRDPRDMPYTFRRVTILSNREILVE
jgi:hypothetical protein